jgi:hypothetical protein
MKGFLHDHSSGFGSRAADTRHPSHAATADPGQSPEACRQAERTAEVGFSLLLLGKARRVAGSFFQGGRMIDAIRFGKKLRVESTFQIKHRLLLWWLKAQAAKEGSEAIAEADTERSRPMHVHEAT